ncbi:hypothetical protein G3I40_42270 [Streptomyces sp. SID14478]|uniref:hypothetical protein n=1 Tax=Streptomyces sp. SID14478 TaxID=2706073 RepID=UPI0013E01EBE|nr:hypothetical protein [Streptomyces sp. SID14478]NEB81795.1 hypothetical protein [Streptomyces sp. SID14478]
MDDEMPEGAMSRAEIAAWAGVGRNVLPGWPLGEPVPNPGRLNDRWPVEQVVYAARVRGFADETGRPIPPDERGKRPVPYPHVSPETDVKRYYLPDVLAILAVPETTFRHWMNVREVKPRFAGPEYTVRDQSDELDGQRPAWHAATLADLAERKGLRLDLNARRTRPS